MEHASRILSCSFSRTRVTAGEPVTLSICCDSEFAGVFVGMSYRLPGQLCPPSLEYHAGEHVAYLAHEGSLLIRNGGPLDTDPSPLSMCIGLDTMGWKPWLYYFRVVVARCPDETMDPVDLTVNHWRPEVAETQEARNLCLEVAGPADHLEVEVSRPWVLAEGTHARRMTRLASGTLLLGPYRSSDHGRTWQAAEERAGAKAWHQLSDGTVLGLAGSPQPITGRKGWYAGDLWLSHDEARSWERREARFHVPRAKPAMGHGPHKGPLFMGSVVERPDGSLLAAMAGWFRGDDEICPYGNGRPYSRTYTCESRDRGSTWHYLSTIGYDRIGSEGYNEVTIRVLPGGDLLAVMRTGSMVSGITQDNPVMVARSGDGGRTWTAPWRSGVNGAFPDLLVLSDGMLALSTGRPGAAVLFSTDEGRSWTDWTSVDSTPYSGYTAMVELEPGRILCAFGTRGYIDPETGERSDAIRLAEITYREPF